MNDLEVSSMNTFPKNKTLIPGQIYTYVIPGNPIPWARAGLNQDRFYDKQKHLKLSFGLVLQNLHGNRPLFSDPLHVQFIFYLKETKRNPSGNYHHTRPDLSNLIKFIEDASTGIIYVDDSLICSINAEKKYDSNPRTEMFVKVIHG